MTSWKHPRKPAHYGTLRKSFSGTFYSKSIFASAREYHQRHPWRLNQDGIMVRHSYKEMTQESLSWWDDLGFIFAKRRVMVWWQHPRMVYQDRLEERAAELCIAASPKKEDWLLHSTPIRKRIRQGLRMKTMGYRMSPVSEEYRRYFDYLQATQDALSTQDQGLIIKPSLRSEVLDWCQGVNLVVPMEVRCEDDLRLLRDLVERHLRGDRSALAGFPAYTFADWQRDQEQQQRKQEAAEAPAT